MAHGSRFTSFLYSFRNARYYCKAATCKNEFKCKLLVVGGGAGGCSVAWRFSKKLKNNEIIVIEPSQVHYYQPLFSLVAAGQEKLSHCSRPLPTILPRNVAWLRDEVTDFDPCNNVVYTACGYKVHYDYMLVGIGLKNDYDEIPGLKAALDNPKSPVCTIFAPQYCEKTWCIIQQFLGGHALFTFPARVGKCSGAAQKIMYLADDYWRKNTKRHLTNITYNTGGAALSGVPKYALALTKVACDRDIAVNYHAHLVELNKQSAVFADSEGQTITLPFNFLHVTPPMSPPTCLSKCEELSTEAGYLDVDRYTLQHRCFSNVYGVGDCLSTPNSKTAAAVAQQSFVVEHNLLNTIAGKEPTHKYNGYGACPILTSYKTGILTEFIYDKRPHETFPFDQSQERRLFYSLNKYYFPYLYWNKLIRGKWNGPTTMRKILNPFGR